MKGESFKDFGIEVEQQSENSTPAVDRVDFSKMRDGFFLSRIDVSSNEPTNDAVFSESDIAALKKAVGAEEIPKEEAEKFGLEDHPLHIEHMNRTA